MSGSKRDARKLANYILNANRNGQSYREIATDLYVFGGGDFKTPNPIKAGTINRIANSKGEWLPKDEDILKALGLLKPRSLFAILPRWFKRTAENLQWFKSKRQQVKILYRNTRKPEEDQHEYEHVDWRS